MTWTALQLTTPASPPPVLSASVAVLSVTPWDFHAREGEGAHSWLSFPNAVTALANKITDEAALFAIAVSAANAKDLAAQISTLTENLHIKQLLQWQRHAAALVHLERDKFALVDSVAVSVSAQVNAIPEIAERYKKALSEQALADAIALGDTDPLANLTAFEADKTAHDDSVNTPLPALAGGDGWRFYSAGDIAGDLRTGHPGAEYAMTAILAFTGAPADLAYLVEMMP